MNSRGCITHTTVSLGVAGSYSEPPVAALSAVRSTTFVVIVPAGTLRGFQSVLRKPAVACPEDPGELICRHAGTRRLALIWINGRLIRQNRQIFDVSVNPRWRSESRVPCFISATPDLAFEDFERLAHLADGIFDAGGA